MRQWIYLGGLTLFAIVIFIEGRRGLNYTNTFEYHVEECLDGQKKVRNYCCHEYCKNATKCYYGQSREYVYPNGTKEEVCICYVCRPKEWFFNWIKNRVLSDGSVTVDFSYCTILLPQRAHQLCQSYCRSGEKCEDGKCDVNQRNETTNSCNCVKCPKHDENFRPVYDPLF